MKKTIGAAFLLAASLFTQAASAGEMTLFSREDFRGERVVLQDGAAGDFRDFGFNDRASSLVVRSGTWELCEHRNFQGRCAVFQRGEYPDLRRFNNNFSSARELDRRHGNGHAYGRDNRDERMERRREREEERRYREDQRHDERGDRGGYRPDAVELFNDNGLGGRRVPVNSDIRSLRDLGFNDNANSMIVNHGTWELCDDANYGGRCRVFGPGRYPDLQDLSDRISSLRRVR